jgi:hypothetical protein
MPRFTDRKTLKQKGVVTNSGGDERVKWVTCQGFDGALAGSEIALKPGAGARLCTRRFRDEKTLRPLEKTQIFG